MVKKILKNMYKVIDNMNDRLLQKIIKTEKLRENNKLLEDIDKDIKKLK